MISPELLQLLRCPLTKAPLVVAGGELVARVNELIDRRQLLNEGGEVVEELIEQGLCDAEETRLYPVRNDIPCLLVDQAIPLGPLAPHAKRR